MLKIMVVIIVHVTKFLWMTWQFRNTLYTLIATLRLV